MGTKVKGQVFRVYEKTFSGKPAYSLKLEDNPIYYRLGNKRYAGIAEPGNVVEFEASEVNADGKSATVTGEVKLAPKAASAAPAASGVNYAARDASIQYQSARKDALAFAELLVNSQAIKLPAKDAARLAVLEAVVDKYTAQFYEDISTLGAVTRVSGQDQEGAEESAGGSEDDDE